MQKLYFSRLVRGFIRSILLIAVSFLALIALICVLSVVQGRDDDANRVGVGRIGAAVVLSPTQREDSSTAILQARLDHALDLYRRGLVSHVILTGAGKPDDQISQAAAGKQYLIEHGMPPDALLLEDRGTTTWESLQNVVPLARSNGIGAVLLVGDPFDMLRALKMARDLGMVAYSSPTQTSPLAGNTAEQTSATIREAWAYLVYLFTRQ
jgi:uncharacterized SAM-binding protein YcdF (DUF218 family)